MVLVGAGERGLCAGGDIVAIHRDASALSSSGAGDAEAAQWVSLAKAKACEVAELATNEAVQMHGGMGITDELTIGQAHKRLLVLSRWPEQPHATLDRYAEAM